MQITNCGRGVHKREVVGVERLRCLPKDWYCFTNLDLATGVGRSREIDVILVAEDRIFLIDLKDWSGKISSEGGNWLHNGRDCGPSPVGKIHQNAKDIGSILGEDLRRRSKGGYAPRVVGLVVITGRANVSGIAGSEIGSVFAIDDFIKAVATPQARVAKFGPVSRVFVDTPLTDNKWKNLLSGFFNARTGKIQPGRKRYSTFIALSDHATFEHPGRVFSEYDAIDENTTQTLGTLRLWDFTKADSRFQSEEGRSEIAGRERSVVEYLKDRSEACENAILQPRADDPDRGVAYWEVYDRRQRLKRLTDFMKSEAPRLTREGRIELVRQLLSKVASIHAADAAHLDIGGHSIWLEAPSNVKLSHFMAAQYSQVQSLGQTRYQFLSSAKLPEDLLGGDIHPRRKDVFLLCVASHELIFGTLPKSDGEDMPFEWAAAVDQEQAFQELYPWFESGLALNPMERFKDATAALDAFNEATASRPTAKEVIEGLELFRKPIKSQKQLFNTFPEVESLKESDRVDIWKSVKDGKPVFVKMWKRASWGDQVREGPRILDFLIRAKDLSLSPPTGCARIIEALWLDDAIALISEDVGAPSLSQIIDGDPSRWSNPEVGFNFLQRLTHTVVALHDLGISHGDLKPDNILVIDEGGPTPVLVDLIDFSACNDGDIVTSAYAPGAGGRMERDRFAVTKIADEIFRLATLDHAVSLDLAKAIEACRNTAPENGTLLPLIEAIERAQLPEPVKAKILVCLSIKGAKTGDVLSDEGYFYVRNVVGRQGIIIRGACEEIEVAFDTGGQPIRARRIEVDQKKIGRLSKFEFVKLAAEVSVIRNDLTDLSPLSAVLENPEFKDSWDASATSSPHADTPEEASDENSEPSPAFEDAAIDRIAEESPPQEPPYKVAVKRLWRSLIDAESSLTTDGISQAESVFSRDMKRHIVPFDLASGTFDFNRNDTVGVEKLDQKGHWRRIGELDIGRSRPDRVVIDASHFGVPNHARLVSENQRLRFTSHFELQSLRRRESAISRVLSRQGRISQLADIFEIPTAERPHLVEVRETALNVAKYRLNKTQEDAFHALLSVRPVGILQGPPGTGKTLFIAALAHYALTHGIARNILLASQSHEAVNNAAEAVLRLFVGQEEQPSILRVGNESVVSDRLMPFHTDRVEQLYKDRFRAELRDRLRVVGRTLGLPASVVDDVIFAETTIRPVAEKIDELREVVDPDRQRIDGLISTLQSQIAHLNLPEPFDLREDDAATVLERLRAAMHVRIPKPDRPAPETMARLTTLLQLGQDFVGSVSTAQRGFESFLAGTRQIVAGTCVGLGRPSLGLTAIPFDLVIIDEAARCTASELCVPMQAGRWVVLVGDQAQLEPQHDAGLVSKVAAGADINPLEVLRSDFERLFSNDYGQSSAAVLTKQYRMLPPIGRVVSNTFYGGVLEHGRLTAEIDSSVLPEYLESPITWVSTDCLGIHGEEKREETGTSRVNVAEADAIVSMLKVWAGTAQFINWAFAQTKHAHVIGIICMYAAQRDLVRRKMQAANFSEAFRKIVKVDTVDSYQGKENLIVVVSLVRNNTDGRPERGIATIKEGFLARDNRINVAVSRAMDRLVIVGAKTRWREGGPMNRLAEAIENEYRTGTARIIPASELNKSGAGAKPIAESPVPGGELRL